METSPINIKAAAIFGSLPKMKQNEDSDIDILLISDNVDPRRHKRGKEIAAIKEWLALDIPMDIVLLTTKECISNFRNHNPLFLDIAWEGIILLDEVDFLKSLVEETKAHILEKKIVKLEDGWIFPVPYRASALLSKVSNKEFAIAMLKDGERDLEIGINILEDGYFDKAVCHFQQSVEKAVKAILICFGIFKKTHYIISCKGRGVAYLILRKNRFYIFTKDVHIRFVQVNYRRAMMINIWTKKYMLMPVAHCRSGCE